MTRLTSAPRLIAFVATLLVTASTSAVAGEPPRLEKRGKATQLIVDGKPYLILGGETNNTVSSSLAQMDDIWPRLKRMHLNTVLVAVGWDWVEPEEGKFDFALVDALLEGARKNDLRVVFLWFGSWKNSVSTFTPDWVKRDAQRFPRVRIKGGKSVEVLSTFAEATRDADTRAYVAFLRHLRAADPQFTNVMIQIQNEVGLLGDSRDRSPAAEQAFAAAVPSELTDYLTRNKESLYRDLRKVWDDAGGKTSGSWRELFGDSPAADEIFMAWQYARFMDHMTRAGKAEHPLPVFTNTWIVQPEDHGPGDYPSGGPQPLVIDVWKAGAPSIDFNAPDIYLPEFAEWCARFHRPNNLLFVPEARGDVTGAANAFYCIGRHAALGYSPFGIDSANRLLGQRSGTTAPTTMPDVETLPLPRAYAVLEQLAPLILEHQSAGTISAVSLGQQKPSEKIRLGDYTLNVDLRRNRRDPSQVPPVGYGLFIAVAPDEYVIAGADVEITFTPATEGPEIAGLGRVEAGRFVDGRWVRDRILGGDDVLLNYKLSEAAAENQSGSGIRFGAAPAIHRVKLYRYR